MKPSFACIRRFVNVCVCNRTVNHTQPPPLLIVKPSKPPKSAANVVLTGGKKVLGRKRHILVDTEGNLLLVVVHPANVQDRVGAELVLEDIGRFFPTITKIWADQDYSGDLETIVQDVFAIDFEIIKKDPQVKGFVLLPRRWVVERTFAWLGRARALSKDYEHKVEYSETVIYLASIHLMLKRLRPDPTQRKPYALSTKERGRRQKQALTIA